MKLLVAVDLKKDGGTVLAAAAPWAEKLGCTVDVLYADPFRSFAADTDDPTLASEYHRMEGEDVRDLTALLQHLPEGRRGRALVSAGDPASAICRASKGYDLVLVATAGRTGIMSYVVGSVAEQVVRSCPVPVLVLRYGKTP
jgi:nucleotide-binding universal stress UspA family protein